ncbi:hypothetical protein BDR26DRAFT_985247 [Obelidium mucronatum]|nr:hypothetical protein BDR26DRAFT_985247 [Obelidium mucronatum]
MSTVIGTPTCMAPEVFSGAVYDSRADIYSCGIILQAATSGDLMWDSAAVSLEAQASDPEKRIELHQIDTSQWLADGILVEIEQYPKLLIFWLDDAHKFPIHAIQNSSNSVFLPSYALHRAISSGTISNSKSRKGLSLKLITKVERDLYNSTVLPKMLKSTKNQYKCDQALIDFFNDQKVFYLAAEIKNFLSLN